jgi:hypothetical protein
MALPIIDSDPTAVGRVPHGERITRVTSLAEARAQLRLTGDEAGVVYCQGVPAGIVTAATLDQAVVEGACDVPVAAVMDYVAVPVEPGSDAETTLKSFSRAAWAWLRSRRC